MARDPRLILVALGLFVACASQIRATDDESARAKPAATRGKVADADRPDPPVTVRIATDKPEYRPLEPIDLFVTVESRSKERVVLSSMAAYDVVDLWVHDERGEQVSETRYRQKKFQVIMGKFGVLEPGRPRPFRFKIHPNPLYDMTAPGSYTITAKLPFHVQGGEGEKRGEVGMLGRSVRSNTVQVKVLPPIDDTRVPD